MIINYNVSGSDRKQLVAAIAEHTGEKAKYLGAPGFAYQIGGFTVSVDGKVTIEDNSTAAPLIRFLREKGFLAEDPLADCVADDANEDEETDEDCGICISMPRSLFTDSSMETSRHSSQPRETSSKRLWVWKTFQLRSRTKKFPSPGFRQCLLQRN